MKLQGMLSKNAELRRNNLPRTMAPTVCTVHPNGFKTGSQGIRGYFYVMTTFKSTYFLIKRIMFCVKNNRGTSLISNMFDIAVTIVNPETP